MGTKPIERLYLWKETDKDVFIDSCSIYDHQVDCLRYLWKQFKKKNPGVIVNFPERSGKSVSIVLFLYAIRKLLQQPVLILCKDHTQVEEWQHCISQWTDFSSDDITIEPTKALLKKQIFIKSMSDLVPFTRRSWSVLVYKNDECIGLPQFTNVDFYIWATSTDVMKDLNFLSTIYNWMCPKAKVNFDDGGGDFKKLIHLDAMLEDIVLRQTKITLHENQDNVVDEYKPVKRSKNKDITGTKIKRSKVVQTNVTSNPSDIEIKENVKENKHIVSSNDIAECDNLQEKRDDESTDSFIVDDKEIIGSPKNVEENTQSDCILHYDETPSDIGSPIRDTNMFESNTKFAVNTDEAVSSNHGNNIHNSKPESSIVNSNISSDELKTLKEDELLANAEQKEDEIDILKSKNIKIDINKDKKLSVAKGEDDLDSKLNEMEEKAMKKFKGSFLDSIF